MARNRVEELESTVAELESTIEGLTDELVEAKERIRVLEAELDTDVPTRVPERRTTAEAEQNDVDQAAADADADTDADADAEEASAAGDGPEDSGTDDIIVA